MKIKLDKGAYMPTRAHDTDAGLDIYARDSQIVPAKDSATFDICEVSKEDANDGIGIVPFIYDQVSKYYYRLWLAQEANSIYDIKKYEPKIKEVIIQPPSISQKNTHKEFKLLEGEE